MRAKDDTTRLHHMLDAARKAVEFTAGKTARDFEQDEMLNLSVVRLIEILGEAANGISGELQEAHPEIPWLELRGTRNRLVHGYFEVDNDIVWKITSDNLPDLISNVEKILSSL